MTTDAYITTTGERWRKRFGHSIERVLEGDPVSDALVFAELRALRAQRDELLAALEHLYNCSGSEEAYEQARTTLERVARREEAKGEA